MISFLRKLKKSIITNSEHIKATTDELLWAHKFTNTISNSKWLKDQSFSPGRWAMGYPGLYLLYRIYNDVKPKHILEFGLGESSKLLVQYHRAFESEITIVEHNEDWIKFFSTSNGDWSEFIQVLPLLEKTVAGKQTRTYAQLELIYKKHHYDVIIIDGPYGSPSFSRSQIIDLIANDCLKEEFIIVMDDYNRPGEKETMNSVENLLRDKSITFKTGVYEGQKTTFILCTKGFEYLCEL